MPSGSEALRLLRENAKTLRRELRGLEVPPLTAGELASRSRDVPPNRIPAPRASGEITRLLARIRAGTLDRRELAEEAEDRARQDSSGAFLMVARREPKVEETSAPLAGIPFTVKDIVDVEGLSTTAGSLFPRKATASAPVFRALEAAGAVLIGKTHLHEWAFGVTGENPHFGTVRNPLDPSRITGGSSSGSAVALVSGIGCGSVGTDTGGSIRIPAALTGIHGLKPSFGRLSTEGVTPLSWSLDHVGPMARSADDLERIWSALAGPLPPSPGTGDPARPLARVRIGIPENFFFENLVPGAREAVLGTLDQLADLGAGPVSVQVPEAELAAPARNLIAFAEAAAFHRERLAERPEDFGADVLRNLEAGSRVSSEDLLIALLARRLVADGFSRALDGIDALLVPSIPTGAPEIGAKTLANGEPTRPGLMRLVGPFNLSGHPVVQLPRGRDAFGLPLGVQIVGPYGGEGDILRLARWITG